MSPRRARAVGSSGCQVSYSSRRLSPLDRGLMVRPFRCRRTIAVRCKPAGHGVATCVAAKVRPSVQRCYVRSHDPTQHVDLRGSPGDDPEASGRFYADVFGWEVEGRPAGEFHRIVPGGHFPQPDGSPPRSATCTWASTTSANARPHPDPGGVDPRTLSSQGRSARVGSSSSDDETEERILDKAEQPRGHELWRHHYWAEFNGFNGAFLDPWGNTLILWSKGGSDPDVPEGWTGE